MTLQELAEHIKKSQPVETDIAHDELMLHVEAGAIVPLLTFLRDDPQCQFTELMDICGADYPERTKRFDIVYNLLSVKKNQRVRVKLQSDGQVPVPSAGEVFSSAGWFERETWDMYGVTFAGNHDLRRILTDYGFDGHPLRKDFPLTGFVELRYDEEQKSVVYSPVKLTQAYRTFDFLSPWEGAKYTFAQAAAPQANAPQPQAEKAKAK